MNRLLKTFFDRRSYTDEFLRNLDSKIEGELLDTDKACALLKEAYDKQERVVILSDFDMDGIMAGTLGFAGLSELGFNCSLFLPSTNEGYGFKINSIDRLLATYPDTKYILTCDVGVTCYEGVAYAKDLGITVIVTDHHKEKEGRKINADAHVNPMRLDETYPLKTICGAYVLWRVLSYYAKTYCDVTVSDQIERLKVFAGIGTISDTMTLHNDNRQVVSDSVSISKLLFSTDNRWFLDALEGSPQYKSAFEGLFNVLESFYNKNKIVAEDDINEGFYGFYLAPTFNSVKRLESSILDAFGVFFDSDRSLNYIDNLHDLNEKRKVLVDDHYEHLLTSDQPYAPYVYVSDAPLGICGLLATKLMKVSGMPTIVLNSDEYRGSGRGPSWIKLNTILTDGGFDVSGHEGAFGISVKSDVEIMSLFAFISKVIDEYSSVILEAETNVDYDICISDYDDGDVGFNIPLLSEFIYELKSYRPFGQGFMKPTIKLKFKPDDATVLLMGSDKKHIKFLLPHGFCAIVWGGGLIKDELLSKDMIELYGDLTINKFMDTRTVTFTSSI